jgi:hypothetical protein
MTHQFHESLNTIHLAWQQSWLKYLLKFTEMDRVLQSKDINQYFMHDFIQAYLSLPSLLSKWLFSYLHEDLEVLHFQRVIQIANYLNKSHLLTPENFRIVLEQDQPNSLLLAYHHLFSHELLNQDNFTRITLHRGIFFLSNAIICLSKSRTLNQLNFNSLLAHENAQDFSAAIVEIDQRLRLNQEYFDLLTQHPHLRNLADVFKHLNTYLEEDYIKALIHPDSAILFSLEARDFWHRIPGHILRRYMTRILAVSILERPLIALYDLCNEIMHIEFRPFPHAYVVNYLNHARRPRARLQRIESMNHEQSTHTSSVHRSVSDSARRLKKSYGRGLNIEHTLAQFKSFLNTLERTSMREIAAKQAILVLTNPIHHFIEPISNVSLIELLALAYIAIHDCSKCLAKIDDAKALLVDGLYEIQRGYNIEHQHPDEEEDLSLCLSGAFNKLMEKLNGIHRDVEICFITHGMATIKFPIIIKQVFMRYLSQLVQVKTAHDYQTSLQIIQKLKADQNIEEIWPKIQSAVISELWDEFHEAYYNNSRHPDFNALINSGIYFTPPDLTEIETKLLASPGHQAWKQLHLHSFWSLQPSDRSENNILQYDMV